MIRLIIRTVFLLAVSSCFAQVNYSAKHSKEFGDYLYNTGQFDIAAQEYERALFLAPGDTSTHLMLFKSYCQTSRGDKALQSYYSLSRDTSLANLMNGFADAYMQELIQSGNYSQARDLANKGCCVSEKERSLLVIYLMQKDWDKANYVGLMNKDVYTDQQFENLVDLSFRAKNARFKKRGLSALMSAIIPGSGKFYSGYWQDGLISLVMTSVSGFMAVRSYNKYGINNAYTWVSGVMAAGYYGGNIYGGYRSAQRYNNRLEQQFIDEAKDIYNMGP